MNSYFYISVEEKKDKTEKLCANINCNFPGSYCSLEDDDTPKCMCDKLDCVNDKVKVCGEDGQTYTSKCDLLKFSCVKQTEIKIAYTGQCSQGFINFHFKFDNKIILIKSYINDLLASLLTVIFSNQNLKQGNKIRSKTNHSNLMSHDINKNRPLTSIANEIKKSTYKSESEYYNKIFETNEKLYKNSNNYLLFNSSNQDPIYSSLNMTLMSSFAVKQFFFDNQYYFKSILCIIFVFKYLFYNELI